jgi:hypothetical protein
MNSKYEADWLLKYTRNRSTSQNLFLKGGCGPAAGGCGGPIYGGGSC